MLLLPGSGCVRTKVVEKPVPVKVEPCHLGPVPNLADVNFVRCQSVDEAGDTVDVPCTTPQELATLAAWVSAMADWVDRVDSCPYVVKLTLADLLPKNGNLKP